MEYPQLHKSLNRRLNVVNIFLGPNKTYFIRWWQGYRTNTRYNYSLPPAIESVIAKISEDGGTPYSVALGISQTYVIVYWTSSRRVRWKWDLKGYYGNLESILKTAISAPEVGFPQTIGMETLDR